MELSNNNSELTQRDNRYGMTGSSNFWRGTKMWRKMPQFSGNSFQLMVHGLLKL